MKKSMLAMLAVAALASANAMADSEGAKTLFQAQCASCHGPSAQGMGMFPKLVGQSADELASKLKTYRAGDQVGAMTAVMAPVAKGLSDTNITDLSAYIASLQ